MSLGPYRPQQTDSLHDLFIPSDHRGEEPLKDYSVTSGNVTVYFRDHIARCLEFINKHEVIVGAVAWLTSEPILRALSTRKVVQIVVQKEDFLRPDSGKMHDLRAAYSRLPGGNRFSMGGVLGSMSTSGDVGIEAVRCVGNHNSERNPAFPRAHHKFLVGCSLHTHLTDPDEIDLNDFYFYMKPRTVWTGSFNLTANGARSFENVVVINDENVALAYYNEWNQLAAISEPLDWKSKWCQPEWRIGT